MSDFISDLGIRAEQYWQKWENFRKQHDLKEFKPSTVAFKSQDIANFNQILGLLLDQDLVNQCHIGFVDKRYIASIVLHKPLFKDIYIIKLMQRRPNSTDPVGLDHMDFYVDRLNDIEDYFKSKDLAKWDYETNESHKWISLRFDNTEAKFVDHLVLDVCVMELRNVSSKIGFKPISL